MRRRSFICSCNAYLINRDLPFPIAIALPDFSRYPICFLRLW
jgi:hypothetical protein